MVAHLDEATTLLQQLIQLNTDTANGHESTVADVLEQLFTDAGIATKRIPFAEGRDNLVAEFGEGSPVFAFGGHEDVVNPGDLSKWQYPPFSAAIEGDRLYGRGASDMKSGLVAMALAFIHLKQSGFPHHVRFIATVGEEYGAPGSRQLTELGYADDLDALVLGEPTGNVIEFGHAGSYNYEITSQGQAVHSSIPNQGINATTKLVDFAVAERTAFDDAPVDPVLGPLVHSVTILKAGDQVNTIPGSARLAGNIRPTKAFTNEQVTARLQEVVQAISDKGPGTLEFHLTHSFYPVVTAKDGRLVTTANAGIAAASGQPVPLATFSGATDASEFTKSSNQFETIIFGPGNEDGNVSHQVNEYVSLTRFHQAINEYEQIARHYFA